MKPFLLAILLLLIMLLGQSKSTKSNQGKTSNIELDKEYKLNYAPYIFANAVNSDSFSIKTSIAQLRNINSISKQYIMLEGYYEPGDGGGGLFYWDAASTDNDNGGTIIKPTSFATGRYKRLYDGVLNADYFGAKKDDSSYDNSPHINSLFAYIKNDKALFGNNAPVIEFSTGIYYFDKLIDFDRLGSSVLKVKIKGSNKYGSTFLRTRNVSGFDNFIYCGARAVEFKNLYIGSGTTGVNAPDTLVNAKDATNSIFEDCNFVNGEKVNLRIGKYYNKITNCIFDGHSNQEAKGLLIMNDSTGVHNAEQVNYLIVKGSQFKQLEHGIWINGRNGFSIRITDNAFEDNNSVSIYCEKYLNNLFISNNYFEANGFYQGDLDSIDSPQPISMHYWDRIGTDDYNTAIKDAYGCIVLGNRQADNATVTNLHYRNVIIEKNTFNNNAKRAILSYTAVGSLKFIDNRIVVAAYTPDTIFKSIGAGSPKGVAKRIYLEFIDETKENDTEHFTGKVFYADDSHAECNTNVEIKYIDSWGKINLSKVVDGKEIANYIEEVTLTETTRWSSIEKIAVPSSEYASGKVGDIAWDENYIYVCVKTNYWKRIALTSW